MPANLIGDIIPDNMCLHLELDCFVSVCVCWGMCLDEKTVVKIMDGVILCDFSELLACDNVFFSFP